MTRFAQSWHQSSRSTAWWPCWVQSSQHLWQCPPGVLRWRTLWRITWDNLGEVDNSNKSQLKPCQGRWSSVHSKVVHPEGWRNNWTLKATHHWGCLSLSSYQPRVSVCSVLGNQKELILEPAANCYHLTGLNSYTIPLFTTSSHFLFYFPFLLMLFFSLSKKRVRFP